MPHNVHSAFACWQFLLSKNDQRPLYYCITWNHELSGNTNRLNDYAKWIYGEQLVRKHHRGPICKKFSSIYAHNILPLNKSNRRSLSPVRRHSLLHCPNSRNTLLSSRVSNLHASGWPRSTNYKLLTILNFDESINGNSCRHKHHISYFY